MSSREVSDGESGDTQVKRGSAPSNLPVPIEEEASPEAYRRAPTMMAGTSAGSRGKVQVWAPDLRRLRWTTFSCILWVITAPALAIIPQVGASEGAVSLVFGLLALFGTIQAFRRPGYVSTDDAGIAVHTPQGSRTIAWNEIRSLQGHSKDAAGTLVLKAPDPIPIHLAGYTRRRREELHSLILERAQLIRDRSGYMR